MVQESFTKRTGVLTVREEVLEMTVRDDRVWGMESSSVWLDHLC